MLALAMASAATAAPLDWRMAGGGLFAGRPASADGADTIPQAEDVRLPELDQPYMAQIQAAASRYRLDPKLLHALVIVESAYRPGATSSAGAAGLTQLMPATAADVGVHARYDVAQNLDGGAAYLTRMLVRFKDLRLALAAYNAGPRRVEQTGGIPSIPETKAYVNAVIDCYLALSAARSVRTASKCSEPDDLAAR